MKNEEKSQEIVNKHFEWISNFVEDNNLSKEDRNQIRFKMYSACQEMVEWKERQLKKRVEKVSVSYKYLLSDNVNPRAVKEHLAQRLIEFMVMTKLVEIKEVQNDDEATIFMQVNVLKKNEKNENQSRLQRGMQDDREAQHPG